jgi:hypothetical protein
MAIIRHDRWTEEEVLSLPPGEQDFFDRKSGAIVAKNTFDDDLAKALSAFANSGGGHLILGVRDDGVIDGVPDVIKGRTKTKDWIEQKIPGLLNYPLQDFSVHEVIPASPTLIPAGQVVIVIDVGDSPLAPHQITKNHLYYYRAGGRSERAPHFFLELLWGRQNRYPGSKVARAWLDSVITPALNVVLNEQAYLSQASRAFDRLEMHDKGLAFIQIDARINSANLEQFSDFYPDVKGLVSRHDKEVVEADLALEELYEKLLDGPSLRTAYETATSPERLAITTEILRKRGDPAMIPTNIIQAVFGSFGVEHNHSILAQHIVRRSPDQSEHESFAAIWNPNREDLMSILDRQPYHCYEDKIVRRRQILLRTVGELIEMLKAKQRELAIKFGEPYAAY